MAEQASSPQLRGCLLLAKNDGPLSASYINPLIAEHRRWTIEIRDWLLGEFYASGYPPRH